MLLGFLGGLAIGFSLAAPPGPINAIIARQAVRGGAPSAVRVGLAAPVVDTLYMALLLFGLDRAVDLDAFERPAAAVGAVLMMYFAYGAARPDVPGARGGGSSFWGVFAVSASNPYQLAWWLSGGTVLLRQGGPLAVAGFLIAIYGWVFTFSHLVGRGAQRWDWFAPAVQLASTDLLAAFSLLLGVTAAG